MIAAFPREARADPVTVVTTIVGVIQKLDNAYNWEACYVGNVCLESETLVDTTNVINAIDATLFSMDQATLTACSLDLIGRSQDDYGNLTWLATQPGHVSPEAGEGGAIGLIEEGDRVRIDIPERRIDLRVDAATLAKRRAAMQARGADAWRPNRDRKISEALEAYALMTTSAAKGAVRDLGQLRRSR